MSLPLTVALSVALSAPAAWDLIPARPTQAATTPIQLNPFVAPQAVLTPPAAPSLKPLPPSPAAIPKAVPSGVLKTYLGLPTGNAWIASGLSLAVNGWGQFYNGDDDQGRLMLSSLAIFPVAWGFDALTGSSYTRIFGFALLAAIKTWSVWDACQGAHPQYQMPQPLPTATPTTQK